MDIIQQLELMFKTISNSENDVRKRKETRVFIVDVKDNFADFNKAYATWMKEKVYSQLERQAWQVYRQM